MNLNNDLNTNINFLKEQNEKLFQDNKKFWE